MLKVASREVGHQSAQSEGSHYHERTWQGGAKFPARTIFPHTRSVDCHLVSPARLPHSRSACLHKLTPQSPGRGWRSFLSISKPTPICGIRRSEISKSRKDGCGSKIYPSIRPLIFART